MPPCNTIAHILPGDPVLRTWQIWDNCQALSTNVGILPVGERFYGCCHGGDVALNTTEGVGRPSKKPLKRIQTGVGVESSRLETKFARTRASTLISGRRERELHLEIGFNKASYPRTVWARVGFHIVHQLRRHLSSSGRKAEQREDCSRGHKK